MHVHGHAELLVEQLLRELVFLVGCLIVLELFLSRLELELVRREFQLVFLKLFGREFFIQFFCEFQLVLCGLLVELQFLGSFFQLFLLRF